MGLESGVNGVIPLKNEPGLPEAVAVLKEYIGPEAEDGISLLKGVDGEFDLWIDLYSTSFRTHESYLKAIPDFAEKWAREPATLTAKCEQDTEDWIVGPKGFDPVRVEIANIDSEMRHLRERRAALVKKRTKR